MTCEARGAEAPARYGDVLSPLRRRASAVRSPMHATTATAPAAVSPGDRATSASAARSTTALAGIAAAVTARMASRRGLDHARLHPLPYALVERPVRELGGEQQTAGVDRCGDVPVAEGSRRSLPTAAARTGSGAVRPGGESCRNMRTIASAAPAKSGARGSGVERGRDPERGRERDCAGCRR